MYYYPTGYQPPPAHQPPYNWRYYLCVQDADNSERVWHVYLVSEIMVGRDGYCYIILSDKGVSRRHCRIYHYNNYVMIENLSKTNPTKHNGKEMHTTEILNVGDSFKCGNVTLVVSAIWYNSNIY